MVTKIVSERYIKKDIKFKIKNFHHTEEYMRGYMVACYVLGAIEKNTLNELKIYQKIKEKDIANNNRRDPVKQK